MKAVNVDEVLKILHKYGRYIFVTDEKKYSDMEYEIANLKALKQEQKTGHWIRITNGAMKEKYICSECGRQIENDGIESLLPIKYPYCHCGAKMIEPQESEG